MFITDALCGRVVEDIRRNQDGSVSLYTDGNAEPVTLYVLNGQIAPKPVRIILPDAKPIEDYPSERMRLLQAFQGLTVKYCNFEDDGQLRFVFDKKSDQVAHRELVLTHKNGFISEIPPVSVIVGMVGQSVFSKG